MADELLPKEIQIARLRLTKDYPYLATAAWSFIPVKSHVVPIMGTDKFWRLYFNPDTINRLTSEEITGVLYHEILHHLREHLQRAEHHGFQDFAWNIAADLEINDDLRREGVKLPVGGIFPENVKNRHTGRPFEEDLMAETYYDGLERQESPCTCNDGNPQNEPGRDSGTGSGDGKTDQTSGSTPNAGSGDEKTDSDGQGNDEGAGQDEHKCKKSTSQDQNQSSKNSSQDQQDGSGDSNQNDGSEGGGSNADPNCPMHGENGIPASSSSGQQPAEWELREGEARSVGKTEGELVRRTTAKEIEKAAKTRGDVPAFLERWADEKLKPQVPWRQVLRGAVRSAVAEKMGAVDYTYRRISRRQSAFPEVVLPALRQPTPRVMIGIDTSGSMSQHELAQGLSEVGACLKAIGVNELEVFTVDAQIQTTQKVRRVSQVKMAGGGGTDMGLAVEFAQQQKPLPDILVVFTDGYTPWPARAPKGINTVIVTTGDPGPTWAKTIKVEVSE